MATLNDRRTIQQHELAEALSTAILSMEAYRRWLCLGTNAMPEAIAALEILHGETMRIAHEAQELLETERSIFLAGQNAT